MKKICVSVVLGVLSICYAQAQTAPAQIQLQYIRVKSFNNTNSILLTDIEAFSKLIADNKITHVFYNDNIFFIQSAALTNPISIASNGYKNLEDYMNGGGVCKWGFVLLCGRA